MTRLALVEIAPLDSVSCGVCRHLFDSLTALERCTLFAGDQVYSKAADDGWVTLRLPACIEAENRASAAHDTLPPSPAEEDGA